MTEKSLKAAVSNLETETNLLIINEQHKLLPEQEWLIDYHYEFQIIKPVKIPAAGWTIAEMDAWLESIDWQTISDVIFVSPVPYLIRGVMMNLGWAKLFVNEKREKKELPDGRIVMVLAQDGWQII